MLDTNVIVSAAIKSSGPPARIVESAIVRAEVQIVVSPSIATEYRRVVRYSKFAQHNFPPAWLEFLIEESLHCADGPPWPHALPDADDSIFLAAAEKTGAWLITGNLRHFPTDARGGVVVQSPGEYCGWLEKREP